MKHVLHTLTTLLSLGASALANSSCGPPPKEPAAIVHPTDSRPQPGEQQPPLEVPDTRAGIIASQLVTSERRATPETYRDGLGYDTQNLLANNLYLTDAVDTVKDRTQHPAYGFVEIPREEFTLAYPTFEADFNALLNNNADAIIANLESPAGVQAVSYAFGILPYQDGTGTIRYDKRFGYLGILAHDAEGQWILERLSELNTSTQPLETLLTKILGMYVPQP